MSSNMPMTSGNSRQADLAYAAGYIDGEGCLQAYYQPTQKHFRVNVTNTYLPTLQWLCQSFGGSVNRCTQKNLLGKKVCYNWCVTGQKAYDFLELIIPYMREKKDLAILMLKIWDNRHDTGLFKSLVAERKKRFGRAAAETKREGVQK